MKNSVPARQGKGVTIKGRAIPFSFYPVTRSTRRYGLQFRIFSTNPWGVMRQSIEDSVANKQRRSQTLSFLEQAENFYASAKASTVIAAKPLLFYYCFLNIAKAFCMKADVRSNYDKARHGLQEGVSPGGHEFTDSFVKAFRSTPTQSNIFDDLRDALKRPQLPSAGRVYQLKCLAPQLLHGHRMWCEAADEKERFIEVHDLSFLKDDISKKLWLTIDFVSDDLTRFNISHQQLIDQSGLKGKFRRVVCNDAHRNSKILRFEQVTPIPYTGRAADKIRSVVDMIRPYLWSSATIIHPYRKHYVYLCPTSERQSMMPQILSIYAYFYYLGSVTRYKPYYFDEILSGGFGGHVQELIVNLPPQFLYLLASEFSDREIAHAPIVQ